MAKKSIIAREEKRARTIERFAAKRAEVKAQLQKLYKALEESGDEDGSGEIGAQIFELQLKLQSMPRNASQSRFTRRCQITGRPRGVYRKFGMSRNKLREYAMGGVIPGVKKASW